MNILTGKFKKLSHPIRAFFIKRDIVNLGLNLNLAEILVDGTVNYNGDVNLPFQDLESFPFKFGVINGAFNCSDNHLTTLKNAPHIVNGDFYCSRNRLSSLKFMPEVISGSVFCRYNELINLEYCPKIIKGSFDCSNNLLTNLEHCPEHIGEHFTSDLNFIEDLKFFPKKIVGDAFLVCNPVQDISTLSRCHIGGEFLIGGLRFVCEDDDERNTPVKVVEDSELEFKFKSDEINELKDSLTVELNKPTIITKRKMKI